MPEDKELTRKRASYKGRLTFFSNYLNSLDPSTLSTSEVSELQLRLSRLEAMYEQYDEVQVSLECNTDNMDSQLLERSEFESIYYKSISRAQEILANYKKTDQVNSDATLISSNHKFVKLPTIQLPKFNGSYTNWLEFHDTFVSLIHSNDDMNDINKFHYLRSSLEGSAAVVINSIQFSAANYSVAWQLLCGRFDNKHLLTQHHVSTLFNIDVIHKESSVILKNLIDQINKNLRALESLGEPVNQWDTLLIYIITHKLDSKTYREWEEYKGNLEKNSKITFPTFLTFIKNRADIIETLELSNSSATKNANTLKNVKIKTMLVQDYYNKSNTGDDKNNLNPAVFKPKKCQKCSGDHKLSSCPEFLALSCEARLQILPSYKVCFNCLSVGHYANNCKKAGCKICRRKHHTLVHVAEHSKFKNTLSVHKTVNGNDTGNNAIMSTQPNQSANLSLTAKIEHSVLLSTALVNVIGENNIVYTARALLDSGSTSCLMTEVLYKQLGLSGHNVSNSVMGINNSLSQINKMCFVAIKSINNDYMVKINCFVLTSITENVPNKYINPSSLKIPSDICLADPNFNTPAPVDILLGADIFWDLLGSKIIKLGPGQPILCETKLGWLVSGPTGTAMPLPFTKGKCNFTKLVSDDEDNLNDNIQLLLTRFWQLEDVCTSSNHSPEEISCEDHFVKNNTRLENGQFCVKIPLKYPSDLLGESLSRAKHCFSSLERRFKGNLQLYEMYKSFMNEYELLGHMSLCDTTNKDAHFIPHHGVMRECSTTTKLRVVFNASSPTNTGVSFNNLQMIGPVVQDDLLSILIRFRQHKYIIAGDIEKMYRTIVVHPNDRHLQQIV